MFVKRADDSTSCVAGILMGRVEEVAMQTEAQTLHVAVQVMQQLEKELEAAATSAAAMAKITTDVAMEGVRRDVQAQVEQIRTDAQR